MTAFRITEPGTPAVVVHQDGTFEFPGEMTMDERAREFVAAVGRLVSVRAGRPPVVTKPAPVGWREVLEPFAREADMWLDTLPDDARPWVAEPGNKGGSDAAYTVGDLRQARDLLAASEQDEWQDIASAPEHTPVLLWRDDVQRAEVGTVDRSLVGHPDYAYSLWQPITPPKEDPHG